MTLEPVNLFSDTQTRPTAAMREAMAQAEVGDEQGLSDPTVNSLQQRVAELLGKEAALFLPSGTMCNVIGFRLHVRPGGDEVVLDATSHAARYEAGGAAAISGASVQALTGEGGIFSKQQLEAAIRPPEDRYAPRSRLVSVEQTTNLGGGRIWSLDALGDVTGVARAHGLRTHMDGARLLNACVASGVTAREYARDFDTVWIDFTKGLGAPVGAALAGTSAQIEEAWRHKQMLGGAMRQAGIIAAGALHSLDNHIDRLADDHENARLLAEGLAEIPGIEIDPRQVETNIVIFGVEDAFALCGRLWEAGVQMGPLDAQRVRAVTHLDVDHEAIERALQAAQSLVA